MFDVAEKEYYVQEIGGILLHDAYTVCVIGSGDWRSQ